MGNKGMLIGIAVVAVVVLGAFFAMSQKNSQVSPEISMEVPVPGSDVDETVVEDASGEVREIVVEGNEYSFNPSSITLTQGEKVRLTFNNVGSFPHNFMIDELGVASKTINAGESDTIEFTAGATGTFNFYCGVGNHRDQGMEGSLEVQ